MDFARLLREPADDATAHFLEAWHGPAVQPALAVPTGLLPEPVRRLKALADRCPSAIVQNQLQLDPDWARDGNRRENQGVYLWATDGIGDDPVVWGRFNEPDERWQTEREPLSRFLLQVVIFEAIMGAPHGAAASWITMPQVERALAPLERLPFGSWRWPAEPTWFYAGTDVLASVGPNGPWPPGPTDRFDIYLAARTADALGYLAEVEGIRWDSRR